MLHERTNAYVDYFHDTPVSTDGAIVGQLRWSYEMRAPW